MPKLMLRWIEIKTEQKDSAVEYSRRVWRKGCKKQQQGPVQTGFAIASVPE